MKEIHELLDMAKTYMLMQYFTFGTLLVGYLVFVARFLYRKYRWRFSKQVKEPVFEDMEDTGMTEQIRKNNLYEKMIQDFKPSVLHIDRFRSFDLTKFDYYMQYNAVVIIEKDSNKIVGHYINVTIALV